MKNRLCLSDWKTAGLLSACALVAVLALRGLQDAVFIPLLFLFILYLFGREAGPVYLAGALLCVLASRFGKELWTPVFPAVARLMKLCAALVLAALSFVIMRTGGFPEKLLRLFLKKTKTRRSYFGALALASALFSFTPEAGSAAGAGLFAAAADRYGVSREKVALIANLVSSVVSGTLLLVLSTPELLAAARTGLDAIGGETLPAAAYLKSTLVFLFFPLSAFVVLLMSCSNLRDVDGILHCEKQARSTVNVPALKTLRDAEPSRPALLMGIVPSALLLVVSAGLLCLGWPAENAFLAGTAVMLGASLLVAGSNKTLQTGDLLRPLAGRDALRPVCIGLLALCLAAASAGAGLYDELAEALTVHVPNFLLPCAITLLAALAAWASGSRTAAILLLLPAAMKTGWTAMEESIFLALCTAAVFSGAVAGELLAPHSLSNLAAAAFAGCSLQQHLKTQSVYVLLILACSCLLGFLPIGIGFTSPFGLLITCFGTYAFYDTISKSPDTKTTRG